MPSEVAGSIRKRKKAGSLFAKRGAALVLLALLGGCTQHAPERPAAKGSVKLWFKPRIWHESASDETSPMLAGCVMDELARRDRFRIEQSSYLIVSISTSDAGRVGLRVAQVLVIERFDFSLLAVSEGGPSEEQVKDYQRAHPNLVEVKARWSFIVDSAQPSQPNCQAIATRLEDRFGHKESWMPGGDESKFALPDE